MIQFDYSDYHFPKERYNIKWLVNDKEITATSNYLVPPDHIISGDGATLYFWCGKPGDYTITAAVQHKIKPELTAKKSFVVTLE